MEIKTRFNIHDKVYFVSDGGEIQKSHIWSIEICASGLFGTTIKYWLRAGLVNRYEGKVFATKEELIEILQHGNQDNRS